MLEDYICSKCFIHPFDEKELFYGCYNCGNTSFRVEPTLEQKLNYFRSLHRSLLNLDNIPSIKVVEPGLYQVDVDKLFKDSSNSFFPTNIDELAS